jgi:hypothetical protein
MAELDITESACRRTLQAADARQTIDFRVSIMPASTANAVIESSTRNRSASSSRLPRHQISRSELKTSRNHRRTMRHGARDRLARRRETTTLYAALSEIKSVRTRSSQSRTVMRLKGSADSHQQKKV